MPVEKNVLIDTWISQLVFDFYTLLGREWVSTHSIFKKKSMKGRQVIRCKDGSIKIIEHRPYAPKNYAPKIHIQRIIHKTKNFK